MKNSEIRELTLDDVAKSMAMAIAEDYKPDTTARFKALYVVVFSPNTKSPNTKAIPYVAMLVPIELARFFTRSPIYNAWKCWPCPTAVQYKLHCQLNHLARLSRISFTYNYRCTDYHTANICVLDRAKQIALNCDFNDIARQSMISLMSEWNENLDENWEKPTVFAALVI